MRTFPLRLAAIVIALTTCFGCSSSDSASEATDAISITLSDPSGLRNQASASYTQFAIYPDACPSQEDLAYGRVSSALSVQNVDSSETTIAVSGLKNGNYGFVSLVRDAQCKVIAAGWTSIVVPQHKLVTIQIGTYPQYEACDSSKGERCVEGKCATK
jgi:hypothetical protein